MVLEQSSCTHTSFAHAVARFQLALASEGILKSQVTNHLIYRHNSGGSRVCVSGASVSYLARIFCLWWAGYVSFTHMMLYIDCP